MSGVNSVELPQAIREAAAGIGYIACGFTTTDPFEQFASETARRAELYPEAGDEYRHLARRSDPCVTTPWARSIVVCVRRYGKYRLPDGLTAHIGRSYLGDRRAEACPDHDMPRRMTGALRELGLRVKRGGTPDRAAAARAGVVSIGRNGAAYAAGAGSWINIETWRVDAELPAGEARASPCPDDCRACLQACPTQALSRPYCVRMDRCIAYLSYEAPEPIAPELWSRMGTWIYGCDVCQNVCPLNRAAWQDEEPAPWLDDVADLLHPAALVEMDLETYIARVHPLFWYIPPTPEGLERWHRNARRAGGRPSVSAPREPTV